MNKKKTVLKTFLACLMMALPLVFTACDDDEDTKSYAPKLGELVLDKYEVQLGDTVNYRATIASEGQNYYFAYYYYNTTGSNDEFKRLNIPLEDPRRHGEPNGAIYTKELQAGREYTIAFKATAAFVGSLPNKKLYQDTNVVKATFKILK